MLDHLRQFLLEMGAGFSFVGSQYHLEVGGKDFYLDLLFYHLTLRCFVVVDLKMADFEPAYAGQTNFYLSAVDELLRHPTDQPTVGILLCKSKNRIVVSIPCATSPSPSASPTSISARPSLTPCKAPSPSSPPSKPNFSKPDFSKLNFSKATPRRKTADLRPFPPYPRKRLGNANSRLNETQMEAFRARLLKAIEAFEDSLRIYTLRGGHKDCTEA